MLPQPVPFMKMVQMHIYDLAVYLKKKQNEVS